MKYIILYLSIALLTGACSLKSVEVRNLNDLEAANLKGRVSEVKESYHKVGSSCCPGGDKNDCSQKITVYNNNGYTTEILKIGVQGDTIMMSSYLYNDVAECTSVRNFKSGHLISLENNQIEKGLVQKVDVTDDNGILINTHQFDYQKGLLVNGKTFDTEGKLLNSFSNEYQDGKVKVEIVKDGHGEVFSITRNKRNSHGDIVESIVTHPRDHSEFTVNFEYVYDRNGNWLKQTKIYDDDIISIRTREFKYF